MAIPSPIIVFIVGVCLSLPSFGIPVPNTEVNARDSLPNLLAAVHSARDGRTVTASPYNQKRIWDSRESFEDFITSHRNEPLKKISTKSEELMSSKPVYFDQKTYTTANKIPKIKIQQQGSPNHLPIFLVLNNYGHSTNTNILSKTTKKSNIPNNSEHKSNENDLSLFLPVIFDDDDNEKAEFRRLSIPSQLLPEFEQLRNHQPVELVKDLPGYVFDINKKESQHLISFLRQSTLESLESTESSGKSSSSEEDYLQGGNNPNSKESNKDNEVDKYGISLENDFDEIYSEEDDENVYNYGGEKSSEELKDMMQFFTPRKQGVFATVRPILSLPSIGSPVVPTYSQYSLTDLNQKINKGQSIIRFPLRTRTFNSAISSEEIPYEDHSGSKKHIQRPSHTYNVKTQESDYDPLSRVKILSQTLSSEFVRRLPKINSFTSYPGSRKSSLGLGSGSIRLIPSILYTSEEINHGISGVLGLGQPVSVGLLQ